MQPSKVVKEKSMVNETDVSKDSKISHYARYPIADVLHKISTIIASVPY